MSSGDYEKAQKLSIERGRIVCDVTENPLSDLAQELGDMGGTVFARGLLVKSYRTAYPVVRKSIRTGPGSGTLTTNCGNSGNTTFLPT